MPTTDRVQLAECIEIGAVGFVAKSESFDRLLEAIREVAAVQTLLTADQRTELLLELRPQRAATEARLKPFTRLTPRERQVLQALHEGKQAEALAREWVLSVATIRSQIRSVLQKLGVSSQLQAVALARRAGWHPDP